MSKTPRMTVSGATVAKASLRKIFHVMKFVLLFLFLLYFVLALTLVRFVPGIGGAGFVLTKDDNFYGDIIPVIHTDNASRETVLIDFAGTHDDSLLDRLKVAFVPNPETAVVSVHAGPTGEVNWVEPNIVLVNGRQVDGFFNPVRVTDKNPKGNPFINTPFLENQYIGVCEYGACDEGQIIVFPKENVIGVPVDFS